MQNCLAKNFTELHKELFDDLLRLSVSRYSRVRSEKITEKSLVLKNTLGV